MIVAWRLCHHVTGLKCLRSIYAMRMFKALVLALVAGIALSPVASATTGIPHDPVVTANSATPNVAAQRPAAQTCSAAAFTTVKTFEAGDSASAPLPIRCFEIVTIIDSNGRVLGGTVRVVTCP
jgi:hypothetical protein